MVPHKRQQFLFPSDAIPGHITNPDSHSVPDASPQSGGDPQPLGHERELPESVPPFAPPPPGLAASLTDTSVVTTIADSGPGIPKQYLSKVFDPFFTTKEQGEGSGLGLTIARRIIKKFGGDIRIESQEASGTSCIVTLPVIPLLQPPQEASCTESTSRSTPRPSPS